MECRILNMLRAQGRHISFHTPGHKRAGADITELAYSDNLYAPHGVIADAEREIAKTLGAAESFILTDGSTCGVFAMLYALRSAGVKRIAAPAFSHPSVAHACDALGLTLSAVGQSVRSGIPVFPALAEIERAVRGADALFVTSPDYYGFCAPLAELKELCKREKKPLVADGAHGAHLHFTEKYAGRYADMWVDGAHKSLPALTQGAVVSAAGEWGERLRAGVRCFRTTSPSYPIMASVEYAVKYPRNERIERAAEAFKREHGCVLNDDWSKLLVPFGKAGGEAETYLSSRGVYPEFYDGNYIMFYLSPCTKEKDLRLLGKLLAKLPRGEVERDAPAGAIPIYKEEG